MTEVRPGEIVWAPITFLRKGESVAEVKSRPSLVLEIEGAEVLVAWGTKTARDKPHVSVERGQQLGRNWGLGELTHFYGDWEWVALADLKRVRQPDGMLASPEFITQVRELVYGTT